MTDKNPNDNFTFQAEVQQLLNLVIHSLYSEKEVFLRELISNASDASGRLNFEMMTNPEMREGEFEDTIDIEINKSAKTITIQDYGIGMTRDEVIDNIGTIARSGTKRFVEALSGDESKATRLIGQFGVGFYSAFMVADNVTVTTRKSGQPAESGVIWESNGVDGFKLSETNQEQHGTKIELKLRKDAKDFLDPFTIEGVVAKYSDHISIPIRLRTFKKKEPEEWRNVNRGSALWMRPKTEITDEEYNNFYSTVTADSSEPMIRLHHRVEGRTEYTALLFVPSMPPYDLFDRDRIRNVKLYVRRIFIMDNAENLIPPYLRFVKGVIDSDDLPLNVSREFLQKNDKIRKIQAGVVKKVLSELKRLANKDKETFQKFWDLYGKILKEGIVEDDKNRKAIADVLRFASTKGDGENQIVSFADYVERMKEKQEAIHYVTADSYQAANGSPHLEIFRKNDIEVLLLSDPIDEWVVTHLFEYDEKPLKSIARGDLKLPEFEETDTQEPETVKNVEPLIEKLKSALSERATDVRTSTRLTDSPACLVAGEGAPSNHVKRLLEATGQSFDLPMHRPILEINPQHKLIKNLIDNDERLDDWAHILFDSAALSEGAQLENPAEYVKRVNSLLSDSVKEPSIIITP